jgi:hypothetical protein
MFGYRVVNGTIGTRNFPLNPVFHAVTVDLSAKKLSQSPQWGGLTCPQSCRSIAPL